MTRIDDAESISNNGIKQDDAEREEKKKENHDKMLVS